MRPYDVMRRVSRAGGLAEQQGKEQQLGSLAEQKVLEHYDFFLWVFLCRGRMSQTKIQKEEG